MNKEQQSKSGRKNGTYLNPCQRYGADPFNDKISDSGSVRNKLGLVRRHYGLDRLCDDPSEEVREAVKATGYIKPTPTDAPYESFSVNLDILEDYELF